MFASPSSTAAYLIRSSQWDEDAERYLKWAIETGSGKRNGSVPNVFPSTNFEIIWSTSNLLEGGFLPITLPSKSLEKIRTALARSLELGGGMMGLSEGASVGAWVSADECIGPGIVADGDDTAKAITTLNILGTSASTQPLITHFGGGGYFYTYPGERNPSLSTNCHVLKALVTAADCNVHIGQEVKVTHYLRTSAWTRQIEDKWVDILSTWKSTMQDVDAGSPWGIHAWETSAYAVWTLSLLLSFPWPVQLKMQIRTAIHEGRKAVERGLLNNAHPKTFGYGKLATWMVEASVFQSCLFLPILKRRSLDAFPRLVTKADKYMELIPPLGAMASHLKDACLSPWTLLEMMTTSFLIYQADEYTEGIVQKQHQYHIEDIRETVHQIFENPTNEAVDVTGNPTEGPHTTLITNQMTKDVGKRNSIYKMSSGDQTTAISLDDIRANLNFFVSSIVHCVKQGKEALDTTAASSSNFQPYFEWARGSAALSVGCMHPFALLSCLTGQYGSDCLLDVEQKFLAQDLCLHLATMARMYNDYGSLQRNRSENNLNSHDFPEFVQQSNIGPWSDNISES
ncbi:MAG: hypothetical protein Q9213_004198 [Squamulea squamosa]